MVLYISHYSWKCGKDSERLQLALPKLIADNKKLRDITQQSNQASGQGQNSQYDAAQEADDQRRLVAEQSRLVGEFTEDYRGHRGDEVTCTY